MRSSDRLQGIGIEPLDSPQGYAGLTGRGYDHHRTSLPSKRAASELLPRVHLVVSLLKRWLPGTHQGAVSSDHLD